MVSLQLVTNVPLLAVVSMVLSLNVIPGRRESDELRCAIAHLGISRFRVWSFDDPKPTRRMKLPLSDLSDV